MVRMLSRWFFHAQMASAEVCGTDGITYRNECELKQAACRNQQFIVVASHGDCGTLIHLFVVCEPLHFRKELLTIVCSSLNISTSFCADLCKRVRCEHGARCEDGICVCPTNCPSPSEQLDTLDGDMGICATDGRTYLTECHMQRAACDHGLALQVLHSGPCPTPPADLILVASDYHDASTSLSLPSNALGRKCHCNKQGNFLLSLFSIYCRCCFAPLRSGVKK